jgi:hypothetical protein
MLFRRNARLRRLALLGVVLHALFLAIADFEHHDLLCHFKTPQHCTSCALSPLGSEPRSAVDSHSCCLRDAGRALPAQFDSQGVLLSARTTGRSPPSA